MQRINAVQKREKFRVKEMSLYSKITQRKIPSKRNSALRLLNMFPLILMEIQKCAMKIQLWESFPALEHNTQHKALQFKFKMPNQENVLNTKEREGSKIP